MGSSIIYRIRMFFNIRYRSTYVKLRQITPPPAGQEYYDTQVDLGYNWNKLKNSLKKMGMLTPIRVVQSNTFNENGERKFTILDGNHRVFILYKQLNLDDKVRVNYRQRNKGEILAEKTLMLFHKKQKEYNKNIN